MLIYHLASIGRCIMRVKLVSATDRNQQLAATRDDDRRRNPSAAASERLWTEQLLLERRRFDNVIVGCIVDYNDGERLRHWPPWRWDDSTQASRRDVDVDFGADDGAFDWTDSPTISVGPSGTTSLVADERPPIPTPCWRSTTGLCQNLIRFPSNRKL